MGIFTRKKDAEKAKDESKKIKSTKSLDGNINQVKEYLKSCDDVVYKEFRVGEEQNHHFQLVYIDGMIDKNFVNDSVLHAIMLTAREVPPKTPEVVDKLFELVRYGTLPALELKEIDNLDDAVLSILIGDAVLFIDGIEKLIVIGAKGWPTRGVAEPPTESVIKGPRDGFTETFRVNTALVRRRIRDPKLKLKQMQIGRRSNTDIGILYIEDIALSSIVNEVIRRLKTIDIDAVLESGYIEQMIEDNPFSLFPQVKCTERPDEVSAALYEGKVAILIDNTPYAIIVPVTFNSFFHAAEDYYVRWIPASVMRTIRFFAGTLALILPALYIAVTSYHPGILPSSLVLSIAASREGVPFPAVVEALIMEITFELLREASVRLPVLIGGVVGIVGGLVIGQAAVQAGIVSPIMVIIVAVTAISSFSIPNYCFSNALRIFRFILIGAAGLLGLYGIELALLLIMGHLIKLKSFGVPYMSPFVSFTASDYKDSVVRLPLFTMKKRPIMTAVDKIRMVNNRHMVNQMEDGESNNGGEGNDKK